MTIRIIGIAGGIGSGKSTATDYLRSKGYTVIDADEVSHAVTETGKPALAEIAAAFGAQSIRPDGSLDRKYIADIVFRDSEKLQTLNAILHQYIDAEITDMLQSARQAGCSHPISDLIFLSAPLFFEAHYELRTDQVWLISASDEIRVKRAAARDHADEAAIRARMAKQMPESERIEKADVVIENNQTPEALYKAIDLLLMTAV
jgi:dephospho-CoA kinase